MMNNHPLVSTHYNCILVCGSVCGSVWQCSSLQQSAAVW
jgi:hypothetical protein